MGANGAASGYNLTDSLRFRSSATAYLDRTQSSGNQQKWTFSAWVKRGAIGTYSVLMAAHKSGVTELTEIYFHSDDKLYVALASGTQAWYRNTNRVCRDTSAWYHVVGSVDTTNDSIRVWVNNEESTASIAGAGSFTNFNTHFNSSTASCSIGRRPVLNSWHFDGYITDINFVDGQQLTASDFGEYDEDTGIWKPKKYSGSYGTNGFYSKNGRGTDQSGNGNNFTENNFNTTTSSATTYDIMSDVPTLTDEDTGNFATLNPLQKHPTNITLSEGNLKLTQGTVSDSSCGGTIAMTSGKWYWESYIGALNSKYPVIGIASPDIDYNGIGLSCIRTNTTFYGKTMDGNKWHAITSGSDTGASVSYGSTFSAGDILMIAYDADNGELYFGKNGTWDASSNPATNTSPAYSGITGTKIPASFSYSCNYSINFGQRPFAYTPPTGYKKLNTYNLPDSTIVDGSQYMDTIIYTGNGSTSRSITGLEFSPDFVWIKHRNHPTAHQHNLFDSVRGATKSLHSNSSEYEETLTNGLTAFNSNGFTVGNNAAMNDNSYNYVAWNWRGSDSAASTNTQGTITSTVSANHTSGFAIATYTGTGNIDTVGHGLTVQPDFIMVKDRSATQGWICYTKVIDGSNDALFLDTTAAKGDSGFSGATNTIFNFSVGTSAYSNTSGRNYVMYSFASIEGYSKFGTYTGNGLTPNGPFIYTGFRPAFIIVKRTDASYGWVMFDNKRDTYNYERTYLLANTNGAEATQVEGSGSWTFDFFSNGFRPTGGSAANAINASGGTYIYMAFAENPFKNSLAR